MRALRVLSGDTPTVDRRRATSRPEAGWRCCFGIEAKASGPAISKPAIHEAHTPQWLARDDARVSPFATRWRWRMRQCAYGWEVNAFICARAVKRRACRHAIAPAAQAAIPPRLPRPRHRDMLYGRSRSPLKVKLGQSSTCMLHVCACVRPWYTCLDTCHADWVSSAVSFWG